MNKHIIPLTIILLLVSSSFIGVSNTAEKDAVDIKEPPETSNYLEKLAFYCYDKIGSSNKYNYYKEQLLVEYSNDDIDIAVMPVNTDLLEANSINFSFFQSDHSVANISKLIELGVMEGDFVYTLGFPMSLVGGKRNFVIARNGCIARISDTLDKQNNEYLIDSLIFPGNSGGPVILKPELAHIVGTKSQNASYLIGVVFEVLAYREEAISKQTKRTRIIFEDNSGLASVHPIDFVQETISLVPDRN